MLAGRPNVGKSSLLNRLAGEERAIVTALPGTTRDALREAIQIEGVPIVVVDTAGLRESGDEVERLGMERTRSEMERADVVLVVLEAGKLEAPAGPLPAAGTRITVVNKIDLVPGTPAGRHGEAIHVSAKTGAGLDALRQALLEAAGWSARGETVFLARERHLRALHEARDASAGRRCAGRAMGVLRRGVAPCAGGPRHDHRTRQRRRSAGGNLRALLHRKINPHGSLYRFCK